MKELFESMKDNLGKCYELAFQYISRKGYENPELTLVHGYITDRRSGRCIDHAWIEDKNSVYDAVIEKSFPKRVYYAMYQAEVGKRYSNRETSEMALKFKTYGPWHEVPKGKVKWWKEDISESSLKTRLGKCYMLSWQYINLNGEREKDMKLVHGYLSANGKTIDHAWIEVKNKVVDPVMDKTYPKDVYYSIYGIEPIKFYTYQEAIDNGMKYKVYGPWHRVKTDDTKKWWYESNEKRKKKNNKIVERSNLSEGQRLLVRTPAFLAWFGDWINNPTKASKVVDENGEPLVVYHFSSERFNKFDLSKTRQNMDIPGFYFSNEKQNWQDMGRNLMSVFLNIRNPIKGKPSSKGEGSKVRKRLISAGYDGAISIDEETYETEYLVFSPNQIKSVNNRGEWSFKNSNIFESEEIKMRKVKNENVIEITEDVKVGNGIILEKGDKIKVLTMSEAGQRTGEIQSKDWDRMLDLILTGKDGSGIARSIKDKNKAIARYVAGKKISPRDRFNSFYDKAIDLGATKAEIDLVIANTVIPDNIAEKYQKLKAKKLSSRDLSSVTKEVFKAGFDINYLDNGENNAFTNEGRDAMRRNGRKWTMGYKTEIITSDKTVDFTLDVITDEGGGTSYFSIFSFDGNVVQSRIMGKKEMLLWLKNKLSAY